jgi:integrase
MGMIGKVTKSTVERLSAGQVLWDTTLVGFGARKQLRHVHYLLRYRINGHQRFVSIGRHGMWTPDTARNEAKRLLGLVAARIDPASERPADKRARRPDTWRAETFGHEVTRYLTSKRSSLKARSIREIHRHLLVYAKPLHPIPLGKIDRRTIALRLGEVEQASGGPSRNRFRSSLSAFFAWAIREGLTEVNPVTGTGKANEGNGRDRVLTEPELASILGALGQDDFSDIIRLLVLTGQRREEIGGLRWSEVDWDRELIVLGPERTKNKRLHELPLSKQAMDILSHRRILQHHGGVNSIIRGGSEWVWGRRFTAWSKSKEIFDRRLTIGAYRLHDLRRSVATHMAELGVLPHIIEAILNHVSGHRAGVAGIYNRSRYQDAMREALQTWGNYISALAPKLD